MRRAACVTGILALFAFALGPVPSSTASDEDLATGIRQVKEGDFETAVPTLEGVVLKLQSEPSKSKELAQAYLYLGIAHVGLDHRGAAKDNFRAAMRADKDLRLKEAEFSPKVNGLFNEAKQDAKLAEAQEKRKKPAGTKASPSPGPAAGARAGARAGAQQKAAQKGGSKKWIFLGVGVAAAAGGGVAVLAKPFDFTKFYGTYSVNLTGTETGNCSTGDLGADGLTLSGTKDGSNFTVSLSARLGHRLPVSVPGTIQESGQFMASGSCGNDTCTFTGQTTGTNISGTLSDLDFEGFDCRWIFVGSR